MGNELLPMTDYEQQQCTEIAVWKCEEPGVVSQAVSVVSKPFSWAVSKVIPLKAIEGALTMCNGIAEKFTDVNDIKRDAGVASIAELRCKDLYLSDRLARDVHNWAIGMAGVEGAAAGAAGILGMAADVPALITMSLRVIHKIGACYGWTCQTEEDKGFVMSILSAAGANTVKEKNAALLSLRHIYAMVSSMTWKEMAEQAARNKLGTEAGILAIKHLAKQLGINLTKRKALQAVPILGAGLGAAMNVAFINDVAWAARRTFQERWLMDNNKVIAEGV